MSYQNPAEVTSPQERLSDLNVLYDGGAGSYSVASFLFDDKRTIGIRWNGDEDYSGGPSVFSNPTWFLMPTGLGEVVEDIMNKIRAY